MRRIVCLGVIFLILCGFTGCEKIEHGPAMNLPYEVSEVWIEEVHAQVDSAVTKVADVGTDIELMVGEVDNAVAQAEELAEELRQEASRDNEMEIGQVQEPVEEKTEAEETVVTISGNSVSKEMVPESISVQDTISGNNISKDTVSGNNISKDTISGNNVSRPEIVEPVGEKPTYEAVQSGKEYFSDALFIGDSRTVGLQLYGTLDNADYFAEAGLNLYTLPRTRLKVGEHKKISLEELLEKETYGKIYLMLGINELGYNYDTTLEKYRALVTELRTKQPEALLYVCANLHVTSVRDKHDKTHNNANINKINADIEAFADNRNIFYLDANVLFDDEDGNLDKEIASDDSHIKMEYYDEWCNWLGENTIIK